MVYPFTLPTTSHLSLQSSLSSSTHPSLPQAASTARHALRVALKTHKQLPPGPQQDAHLPTILTALTDYLPYLHALSAGLADKPIETTSGTRELITVIPRADLAPEWRPTLSSPAAATAPSRTRARGHTLDFEIAFVLTTLGYVLSGLAHSGVTRTVYATSTPTADQRTAAVQSATRSLLQASAVHTLLASWPPNLASTSTPPPPDTNPTTQTALASLALSEATLLAVLKDDSYIAACIQARNPHDRDWMVRAPEIPKVRAHLFARLCLRAAEYADQAAAGLGSVGAHAKAKAGVDERLVRYVRVLSRVARARACRFFGVDAELAGRIGEGIAWLRAARGALGVQGGMAGKKDRAEKAEKGAASGLDRLKQGWMERREERRLEKGAGGGSREKSGELGPGDYAGREEEGRVIEMLEVKWVRMNDTINTQLIPPSTDLLNSLPSGRDIHSPPGPYKLPALDDEQLAQMRAPPDDTGSISGESDEEEGDEGLGQMQTGTPGAYPERTESAYY
ncbi:pH-signaling protein PalC [Aspergillus candidus]|uniref:pH-response regulator protein palC n=1 Tax=Aspergillus candidus TaxID=41067 RepID=A0A2I2EY19_ASPCN|nr:hypothetical protein BDW47DRAFT_6357 [Aspergillus candidus]PLB33251.1 hypothetical protein BDW47DRAFT_6357 [Aspergillus candidus]